MKVKARGKRKKNKFLLPLCLSSTSNITLLQLSSSVVVIVTSHLQQNLAGKTVSNLHLTLPVMDHQHIQRKLPNTERTKMSRM